LTSPNEVRIDATLNEDIAEAVARIEQRMNSLERTVGELGRAGGKAGAEFAAGMDKASESADEVGDQARQAKKPVKDLGDETVRTGAKAATGSKGLDTFAKKANNAGKKARFFQTTVTAFKIAGIVTAVFALAGGLSAVGAGAVIAIGGLAPMVGVVAGALPIFAAAKLTMLAWKLAAESMEPTLNRIKGQFTDLGDQIAAGGLRSGLDFFADRLDGLARVTGRGLASLGGQVGDAARQAGRFASSAPFLAQVERIFHGLEPIVGNLTTGLLHLARAIINIIEMAMPMAQAMAADFLTLTKRFQEWTAAQLANGRGAAWLMKSYALFRRTVGVLADFLIGLFNVFRIGGGYAGEMGNSIEATAAKFRAWTESAEGQVRINKYFQDSLPALREMGKLLGMVVSGFGGLAANQNVAPLLAQIRTEFAPALGELVGQLSGQGGLGPALISAATALVKLMASLDFSALTMFVQAIAALATAIVWIGQNVPGASFAISGLVGAFFGFKLLGPVFSLVGKGADAYKWMSKASQGVGKLSVGQRIFAKSVEIMGKVFKVVGGAIIGVIRAIGVAMLANPLLLVIALVVAGLVFMWFKFGWFRDAVIAVWNAIKAAGLAVWQAVLASIRWVVNVATTVWGALVTAWNATVGAIKTAAMRLWTNVFRPVWNVIAKGAEIAFGIIKFIVQTAVYIIMAIVALIAVAFEAMFKGIVAIAKWAWETVLRPIFTAIATAATAVWNIVSAAASFAWNLISTGATWLWSTILLPIFTAARVFMVGVWNAASSAAQELWNAAATGASWLWNNVLSPVFNTVRNVGVAIWTAISNALSATTGVMKASWTTLWAAIKPIFDVIGKAGAAVWDGIKWAAEAAGNVIKGIWNAIVGAVKAVWNAIAGVWNGIPSVTVPDWVPLVGGSTFSLPKMPTLWHGGETPTGRALVGEHGPEPVVVNGAVTGMVGMNGPEITNLPSGGYVVPNLSTLDALPGLTKTLPSSVAAAVARSVPGYADALGPSASGGDSGLSGALDRLSRVLDGQMPPVTVSGTGDITEDVLNAWRTYKREEQASGHYRYQTAGR
jgi:phage-related protein